MNLPFTVDQFFGVFRDYNEAMWPAPLVLMGLAVASIVFVCWPRPWSGAAVAGILAFLWLWIGLVYQWVFFTVINPLAYLFAVMALAGSLVFFWQGVVRSGFRFRCLWNIRSLTGAVLVVFALIVYPLWSWHAGHAYPTMPTFGLPCPTTIFTVGVLAFLEPPYPRSAFVVPLLRCAVGGQAALLLSVPQDLGLLAAGFAGLVLVAFPAKPSAPVERGG